VVCPTVTILILTEGSLWMPMSWFSVQKMYIVSIMLHKRKNWALTVVHN
jgi:hypothetical protein